MNFLIDKNIPLAKEAFYPLGECDFFSGYKFDPNQIKENTYLLVRSITKINSNTFAKNTPIWIGTATAGTDHIDFEFIKNNHIDFAFAPGSNANSVAEYVILTLCHYALKRGDPLNGKSLGIIGCGQVGSRVIEKAKSLGMKIMPVDPPLEKISPNRYPFVEIEKAFTANFVTVHVPLVTSGDYPTFHFITEALFNLMPSSGLFINTSRGKVVRESVILKAVKKGICMALDVFEQEPDIQNEITKKAFILTPHVAGYAVDGKLKGTQMLYDAIVKKNNFPSRFDYAHHLNEKIKKLNKQKDPKEDKKNNPQFAPSLSNKFAEENLSLEQNIVDASACTFDLMKDSFNFKKVLDEAKDNETSRRDLFHAFRKNYNHRFEWNNIFPQIKNQNHSLKEKLTKLGFRMK